MEDQQGFGHPATAAEGRTTVQPERDVQPGDPNLVGAVMVDKEPGIIGKVKGLMGTHGRTKDKATKRSLIDKMKEKTGRSSEDDDPNRRRERLLSMSSSSSMSSSDEEDIGQVGHAMDPTGPPVAGVNLGRHDFFSAPDGPGADVYIHPAPNWRRKGKKHSETIAYRKWPENSNSNRPAAKDREVRRSHSSATGNLNRESGYAEDHRSHSADANVPNQTASGYGEIRSANPMETTDSHSRAVPSDDHENLSGPRDGAVMENFRKVGEDDTIK